MTLDPSSVTPVGTRIRKPLDYVRHYLDTFKNVLENGDLILHEPSRKLWVINPQFPPEPIPEVTVNLVNKWDESLPAYNIASPGTTEKLIRDVDVNPLQLAFYIVYPYDPGFAIKIAQPQTTYRFSNKAGTKRFTWENANRNRFRKEYGYLANIWVMSNQTPLTIQAVSTSMNRASYYARVKFVGYKYQLLEAPDAVLPSDPRVVMTVSTGVEQAA